jgi:cytochrome c oxidase subunit 2
MTKWAIRGASAAAGFALSAVRARADAPMGYMAGHGAVTDPISALGWGLLVVAIAVFVITGGLLIAALTRRREARATGEAGQIPIERSGDGLSWITIGTGISTVVLFGCAIWTMIVLVAVASPTSPPVLTLEVHGHSWWWEVRYLSSDPSRIFTTANEIHIPTGHPVRVRLIGDDVIHAFWVPALAGKMQMIPGQTNETWLEAREPGIYRGQCTQFCGAEHAKMAFSVVAQPDAEFEAWRVAQLASAAPPAPGPIADGQALFATRCGACHTIRGSEAGGILGPDLTHLMTRGRIAAGALPNDPGHLIDWVAHPQAIKPGNQMPDIDLSDPDLHAIVAFLETLK